jgi:NADPH-dependent 2,4-dienoyl-CoA reductase/sulfur reductase-like enzyme
MTSHTKYLIVGGGMAAAAAADGIREVDPGAPITIASAGSIKMPT